ncbi:MAG: 4-hydroxy-tetrahydrodipicolinate synthase [Parvularculaceae bacterium]|nr:MAG: 4-hydroxy-tetrahydrodipicolinate synthase [Parvularculaceae bacterium]
MIDLSGSITALVTPFRGGVLDDDAFQRLVDRQVVNGSSAIVPAGTTGESATLSHEEHHRVIELAVEAAAGRVPVVAGAGSNSTAEAIELARFSQQAGADALLTVTGYYNKPTQAGLIAHFTAVHDATELPMFLYNVPGRTMVSLSVETIATLSALPRIIGIKDATGDLARVALQRLASGADFIQLSGEDMTAVGFNAMGGVGCIGVTANIAPSLCAKMQKATLSGDFASAVAVQDKLAPLHEILFAETSPSPAKYALSRLNLCTPDVRLPLVMPSQRVTERIDRVLDELGIDS